MITMRIAGADDPRPEPSALESGLPSGQVRVKRAIAVGLARAGAPRQVIDGVQPSDIVEFEFQDGLRLWTRAEDVGTDFAHSVGRDAASGVIDLPSELHIGPASRSTGGWAVKALKIIGLDIAGEISSFIADHVEGRLRPGPGLYHCVPGDIPTLTRLRKLGGAQPVLVFLHGTASSTDGSFGDLWRGGATAPMQVLAQYYDGRVVALQHRTLTESPIENAANLAERLAELLDPGAEVHLVSHSRGGLIGELLARGMRVGAAPITPDEIELFSREARDRDVKALRRLNRALKESRIRVTRFVRVACPARGTTLADRRLDRYFSVLVNLASMTGLRGNPVYESLTGVLGGVLEKRTQPEELPGLEAMMPTSPLVRMLNRPDVTTRASLHVLGGDLAPSGIWGRLKTLATDLYYRDDHDLVVNTSAMFGGTERDQPVKYWIDTGGQVTHFHYFARTDTARRLVGALTGETAEFRTLNVPAAVVTSADYAKRAVADQPVVVVLPGIMGSQLTVGKHDVWMNILRLAQGGMAGLALSTPKVSATGLLRDGYADLCKHLAQSHTVVEFPYDWRQPISEAAERLRTTLDELVPQAARLNQPIRLLAHSMGGLVVRAMLATTAGQKTWTALCSHPGARFIMLGTPTRGSHAIAAMLIGRDALVKQLALIDLRNDYQGLLQTIASFEGVLDLLPHAESGQLDLHDAATWERVLELDAPQSRGLFGGSVESSKSAGFRWVVPARASLDRARTLARAISATPLDPARTIYVAGVADETACDIVLDSAAPAGRRVKVMASARGDGRVLWETGIPPDVPAFYMDTVHGDLASDKRHFPALLDLLTTGRTSKLPVRPPARRAAAEVFERRDALPVMVPDQAELVAAALGGRRAPVSPADTAATTVHVRIVHDNLTNARHPVLVGHYQDDVIVAGEAYLDGRLDNRLSELLHMGLYPGASGTAVVVLNDTSPDTLSVHPGAIIAGLGVVGDLSPGRLVATLAQALTMYGAERVGSERRRRQRERLPSTLAGTIAAPVTALLVGSGEGGLSLADCVQALTRAVVVANRRLQQAATQDVGGAIVGPIAQIDQLDIVELYEDRAIEAVHALRGLSRSSEFQNFVLHELLVPGDEGSRRASYASDLAWWQRLRITTSHEALRFEAVTQTARAQAELLPTQRRLVDGFVRHALESTSANRDLGYTLFELLIPSGFKPHAPDRRKLAIVLDAASAALPWELLHDRFDANAEPLSVATGLIRQLLDTSSREQVLRRPDNSAFVLGNPTVSSPTFPPLPGAAEEASAVATLLGGRGFDVTALLGDAANPLAVFTELYRRPWRILHLAAHGVFEPPAAEGQLAKAGLVLDDGLLFTPTEAEQLRYVPELVFINCCHLGQTAGESRRLPAYPHLAANLATQFIRMGTRAVIAAGWAVNDSAAKTFARRFYEEMLEGQLFGDAVRQARKDTYERHAETNTWGAYQCYGDPSFSLRPPVSSASSIKPAAETELLVALEAIALRARADDARADALLRQLTERTSACPAEWWGSAALLSAAGRACAELGQYEQAVGYLERIPNAASAQAPIAALEQLANCKTRIAGSLLAGGKAEQQRASDLLDEAESLLDHLIGIGKTSERCALRGGVMKRRALLPSNTTSDRRDALTGMSTWYGEAVACAANSRDRAYALVNEIAADVVLSWRGTKTAGPQRAIRTALDQLKRLSDELGGTHTDFFSLLSAAERALLAALASRRLSAATVEGLAQRYRDALSRGATRRNRDSMVSQFDFFIAVAALDAPPRQRQAMVRALETLRAVVASPRMSDSGAGQGQGGRAL